MKKVIENEVRLKVGQEVLLEDGSKGIVEEGDRVINEGRSKGTYEVYSDGAEGLYFFVLDNRAKIIYSHVYDILERQAMKNDINNLGEEFDSIYMWDGNENLDLDHVSRMNSAYSFVEEGKY